VATSGIERRRIAAQSGSGSSAYHKRRQEIVQVAAGVFREKGFNEATLNDIAERLDTDRASLYYYVRNKEEILQEIVRGVLTENVAVAERVQAQDATGAEKLAALIQDMVLSFDRNYPHMYVFIEDFPRISRQQSKWARDILGFTRRFESIVSDILTEGQADGSVRPELPVRISALAVFGMVNWTHRWYRPGSEHSAEAIAETLASIFLHGVSGPER
jgi:AcrR family transcriptional regulator